MSKIELNKGSVAAVAKRFGVAESYVENIILSYCASQRFDDYEATAGTSPLNERMSLDNERLRKEVASKERLIGELIIRMPSSVNISDLVS